MRRAVCIGLLACGLVVPYTASARLAGFHFVQLVEDADFIAVGRIVAIDEATSERFADVVVEERIVGDSAPVVRVDTHSTWTCDTSAETRVGDRGLMFLGGPGAVKRFIHSGTGFIRLRNAPIDHLHVGAGVGPIIWPSYIVASAGHSTEPFEMPATRTKPAKIYDLDYLDFSLHDIVDYVRGQRAIVPYR